MKALLATLFLGFSTFAQSNVPVANPEAACGPREAEFQVTTDKSQHSVAKPEPGKALVYVIEDQRQELRRYLGNSDRITKLGLDGTWIGANKGSSYFFFSIEPGEHHLCSSWEFGGKRPQDRISLAHFTAQPGQIAYFRVRVIVISTAGFYSIDLEPVNSDEGQLLVAASPLSIFDQKR